MSGRSSLSAASAARNENKPNRSSPHDPTDIGTHDLNIGLPVLDWISMCQNRRGRSRSIVSRKPAHEHAHEGEIVAQPHERAIGRTAEEMQQRSQQERGAGDPADEEVEDDPPGPMRRAR